MAADQSTVEEWDLIMYQQRVLARLDPQIDDLPFHPAFNDKNDRDGFLVDPRLAVLSRACTLLDSQVQEPKKRSRK